MTEGRKIQKSSSDAFTRLVNSPKHKEIQFTMNILEPVNGWYFCLINNQKY